MAEKKYLDKNGLAYYDTKLKQQVVQATEIRRIEIVDEYPTVEEQGVLYMKVLQ